MRKTMLTSTVAALAFMAGGQAAMALEEITVGYFMEWPMPFEYAKANGTYDAEMGVKVNWRAFDTGTAMSAAMASGDVQFAVSQGVPPFVVATSAGQDLQTIAVAVSYSENDNCVVRSDLEITKDNAKELEGKKVAVPLGTAAHYGFLRQMDHFGIDLSKLQVVDMAPPDGAAALAQSAVDMACGYGGGLNRMKEHGNVLLTGAEKEALGILVFDVISAPATFLAENPDLAAKFMKVTEDANAMWNEGSKQDEMIAVIAKDAGMDLETAKKDISTFIFPSVDEQLSEKWLGGGAQAFMKGVSQVFLDAGSIPAARDTYDAAVNTAPLEAVKGM
ncbi:MAG TPA: ABC transporter substrate-binding protein [Albidovulum sp.]|uniref:taurine ABC transporter substrate-binding protein n=1 Tax=Albidovulum sp. TaxID=1872424 RepID=UPI002BA0EAC8|nr:ABC transporter substrate-binding protein [Albidovulum sp.]